MSEPVDPWHLLRRKNAILEKQNESLERIAAAAEGRSKF